jgi:hypothetical protein
MYNISQLKFMRGPPRPDLDKRVGDFQLLRIFKISNQFLREYQC